MDGIKHSGRFAEMERLVNDYFNCHIAPIMSKTRTDQFAIEVTCRHRRDGCDVE